MNRSRLLALAVTALLIGCSGGSLTGTNGVTPESRERTQGAVAGALASSPPLYAGCDVFPANDPVWNTNISATAADANSANYVSALAAALTSQSNADYIDYSHGVTDWIINAATSADSTFTLIDATSHATIHSINDMRFASTFNWQGKGGGGDHHLMIVNNVNCHVIEGYSSAKEASTGPSWFIGSAPFQNDVETLEDYALEYDLKSPFPAPAPTGTVAQGGGAVTLMGPLFPGLLRWEDYQNNTPHALELDVPNAGMLGGTFVYPAKSNCGAACSGKDSNTPPLGARIVLKTGITLPACIAAGTCPVTAFVVSCLQNYGAYLADQENSGGLIIRMGNFHGTDPWASQASDLLNLHSIIVNSTNFKFIPPPYCKSSIAACKGQNPPTS